MGMLQRQRMAPWLGGIGKRLGVYAVLSTYSNTDCKGISAKRYT